MTSVPYGRSPEQVHAWVCVVSAGDLDPLTSHPLPDPRPQCLGSGPPGGPAASPGSRSSEQQGYGKPKKWEHKPAHRPKVSQQQRHLVAGMGHRAPETGADGEGWGCPPEPVLTDKPRGAHSARPRTPNAPKHLLSSPPRRTWGVVRKRPPRGPGGEQTRILRAFALCLEKRHQTWRSVRTLLSKVVGPPVLCSLASPHTEDGICPSCTDVSNTSSPGLAPWCPGATYMEHWRRHGGCWRC